MDRASVIWRELERAVGDVHAEVPLASQEGDTVRRGVIDLVYRVGDAAGWKIIDYKTHPVMTPALTERFTRQVEFYAEHWEAVSGEPVVERGLWLAASDGKDRYIALP